MPKITILTYFFHKLLNLSTADNVDWVIPRGKDPVHCRYITASWVSFQQMTVAPPSSLIVITKMSPRHVQMFPWRHNCPRWGSLFFDYSYQHRVNIAWSTLKYWPCRSIIKAGGIVGTLTIHQFRSWIADRNGWLNYNSNHAISSHVTKNLLILTWCGR